MRYYIKCSSSEDFDQAKQIRPKRSVKESAVICQDETASILSQEKFRIKNLITVYKSQQIQISLTEIIESR